MLRFFRRSAGLLFALFAGHLSAVAGGAVCTSSSMASMNASPSTPMAAMAGMGESSDRPAASTASGAGAREQATGHSATSDHPPCSSPSEGTCVATMPCVNALGAPQGDVLAIAGDAWSDAVTELTVIMPATLASAPEIPPPRA